MAALNSLSVARSAAVFSLCAILVSPPLANLGLVICLMAFLGSPEARQRFLFVIKEPIGVAVVLMFSSLVLGLAYGLNSLRDGLGELYLNRFWILIPVFAALFFDVRAKRNLAVGYVFFCGLAALLSEFFWLLDFSPRHNPPGILLRDHVTQGMAFAVAAFVGAFLLLHFRQDLSRAVRILIGIAVTASLLNVVYVSTGRSGYVALIVLLVFVAWRTMKMPRYRVLVLSTIGVIVLGLLSSGIVRDRLSLGVDEVNKTPTTGEASSMGYRMVFWQNTIELIKERPLWGHGTGGFDDVYALRVKGVEGWRGDATSDPHNQYLFTLAERGMVGLLALIGFLWLLFRQAGVGDPWRDMAVGVILVWSLTNLVNSHFHTFNQGHFFAMYIGCFLAPLLRRS